ncbi:Kelch repeat-containing protein [Psychroserpens sp.]|uniref:Kelch repeat-containing protein n=1 Tax=Psychroserpens sp. TaxID=2020870 RepID=UPI003C78E050
MKTKIQYFSLVTLLLILSTCENSDDVSTPDPNNNAPDPFNLISINNNSSGLDLNQLSFTWEASTDPDGDSITYDVYFGTDQASIDILINSTITTSYAFDGRFNTCTKYYWKVIAKDNRGGETECISPFNFSTRDLNINNMAFFDDPSFPRRARHQTIVYDNRIWVIGGTTKNGVTNNFIPYNNVYSAEDLTNWEEITNEATSDMRFSKRYGHASVPFDSKMWVIGGNDGELKNDIWSSTDGWNWVQETSNANFPPMDHHKAVVFNNKIWLFHDDDVWNSTDGITWTQINTQAGYLSREGYSVTVFKDEMYVIAGRTTPDDLKNDVWKSNDGITWTQTTTSAPFSARLHHTATVFDDNLYVIGGLEQPILGETNDVWKTSDGLSWSLITNNAVFEERLFHTATVYKNQLIIIAGAQDIFSGQGFQDVWVMD